jgi:predicted RND superfamily exporter protein
LREKILSGWGALSARYPGRLAAAAILVILAVFFILALKLSVTTRWADLLPTHDPLVQEFNKIIEEYTSSSNSIMVVIGPEEKIKAFADEIAPGIESLEEYVMRVEYKIDEEFVRDHGFMLVKSKDLEKSISIYEDLNLIPLLTHINDSFERTYTGDEESLSDREKEDNAIRTLDGLQYWIEVMQIHAGNDHNLSLDLAREAAERILIGDPYFISPDKRTLVIFIEPTFDITDIDSAVLSTDTIQALIDDMLLRYPDVHAGLTGTIPLGRDEMVYSTRDMQTTSILALALVILLFIFSFRIVTSPLLAGLNLILSIMFAAGIISLFIDSLNIMTSMFAVILIGLGIDFSIHIIALYTEYRATGKNPVEAMAQALSRSGAGITTGAVTTSIAFFTLMISDTKGIKEMGLVLGIGILAVMLTTLILLPSLLVLRERANAFLRKRIRPKAAERGNPGIVEFAFLGEFGQMAARRPRKILLIAIALSAVMFYNALNVEFDYNYLNMEPEGIPSVTLGDSLLASFDMSSDFVMITASSVEEAREIAEKAKKVPSVGMVESISEFIPSPEEQARRIPHILKIRSYLQEPENPSTLSEENINLLIDQLDRLEMNIYELGQMAFLGGQERVDKKCARIIGDPEKSSSRNMIIDLIETVRNNPGRTLSGLSSFQNGYMPVLRELALQMADTSGIDLQSLPESISGRFLSKNKDRFLVTITPEEEVWNIEFMRRFTGQMERISEKITGMPPLFLRLIDLIAEDGRRAAAMALAVVFVLLWIDFRRLKLALFAMLPLVSGAVWMVGLLSIFGIPLTVVNVMGIPMIIGIGIDDGVHLLHRYRVEGWGRAKIVLQSTGRAILLTSLTTIAGFGSLMIAKYRGFGSLSYLLVMGVAACFITTVLFLPALVSMIKHKE